MRRSLSVRVVTLAFVVLVTTAPAFAAPRRDDSPIDGIGSAIARLVHNIIQCLDLSQVTGPK